MEIEKEVAEFVDTIKKIRLNIIFRTKRMKG